MISSRDRHLCLGTADANYESRTSFECSGATRVLVLHLEGIMRCGNTALDLPGAALLDSGSGWVYRVEVVCMEDGRDPDPQVPLHFR